MATFTLTPFWRVFWNPTVNGRGSAHIFGDNHMPTTIELPIRTSQGFRRAAIKRGSAGIPIAETALIIWAMTLLLIGAVGNFAAPSVFPDAFQMLAAF
jgi:hypothetical protein